MRKVVTVAIASFVAIVVIFLVVTKLELRLVSGSSSQSTYFDLKPQDAASGTATSGTLFEGSKIRSYTDYHFSRNNFNIAAGNVAVAPDELHCEKWSVVTTIFAPSEAVRRQAHMAGWCLVVVGDRKGPDRC